MTLCISRDLREQGVKVKQSANHSQHRKPRDFHLRSERHRWFNLYLTVQLEVVLQNVNNDGLVNSELVNGKIMFEMLLLYHL